MDKKNKKSNRTAFIVIGAITLVLVCIYNFNYLTDTLFPSDNIGVLEINGTITTSKKYIDDLNYLLDRDDVKAIIIRMNTPGGGVAPSQEIYDKVKSNGNYNRTLICSIYLSYITKRQYGKEKLNNRY